MAECLKQREVTISTLAANLAAIVCMLLLTMLAEMIRHMLWPSSPHEVPFKLALAVAWVLSFPGLIIHELLHAIGFVYICGARWVDIKFSMNLRRLILLCHCPLPLHRSQYMVTSLLPFAVLGLFPLAIGISANSPICTIFGSLMLSAAVGDVWMSSYLLRLPNDTILQDHPSKAGFTILACENKKTCT